MRYLSLCSGIEAASVAWNPLGWKPTAFAEIEPFPAAVLKHHYPHVPNLGDITKFKEWPDVAVDLVCGGTPCQSFSVAGLRAGLADPRGNLMLTFLAIAGRYRPRWVVWENVPGVLSSNDGRDFGTFLSGLGQLGYGWAYRVLDAQYVRVDGFPRAVPQRRRRVFVVGCLGDWACAAAVLSERQSLLGDTAPRRQKGEGATGPIAGCSNGGGANGPGRTADDADSLIAGISPTISSRPTGGGGLGTDFDLDGGLIVPGVSQAMSAKWSKGSGGPAGDEVQNLVAVPSIASTLTRGAESAGKGGYAGRRQEDDHNLVAHTIQTQCGFATEDGTGRGSPLVAHTLRAEYDATEDGTGRGVPLIAFNGRMDPVHGAVPGALDADPLTQCVAFQESQSGFREGDVHATLDSNNGSRRHNGVAYGLRSDAGPPQAVAFMENVRHEIRVSDATDALSTGGGKPGQGYPAALLGMAVRRLTPKECERLMGFPDGYTDVPYRGKSASDGPRYKALGNSWAVNCVRWIGRRIEMVEAIA